MPARHTGAVKGALLNSTVLDRATPLVIRGLDRRGRVAYENVYSQRLGSFERANHSFHSRSSSRVISQSFSCITRSQCPQSHLPRFGSQVHCAVSFAGLLTLRLYLDVSAAFQGTLLLLALQTPHNAALYAAPQAFHRCSHTDTFRHKSTEKTPLSRSPCAGSSLIPTFLSQKETAAYFNDSMLPGMQAIADRLVRPQGPFLGSRGLCVGSVLERRSAALKSQPFLVIRYFCNSDSNQSAVSRTHFNSYALIASSCLLVVCSCSSSRCVRLR